MTMEELIDYVKASKDVCDENQKRCETFKYKESAIFWHGSSNALENVLIMLGIRDIKEKGGEN